MPPTLLFIPKSEYCQIKALGARRWEHNISLNWSRTNSKKVPSQYSLGQSGAGKGPRLSVYIDDKGKRPVNCVKGKVAPTWEPRVNKLHETIKQARLGGIACNTSFGVSGPVITVVLSYLRPSRSKAIAITSSFASSSHNPLYPSCNKRASILSFIIEWASSLCYPEGPNSSRQ
jgi:hypothetical protein